MARNTGARRRIEPHLESDVEAVSRTPKKAENRRRSGPKSRRRKRTGAKKRSWLWRLIAYSLRPVPKLAYWGTVFCLWGGIVAVGIIGYFAASLPSADNWAVPKRPPSIKILANDGSLLGTRGTTGGEALRLEEMSPYIAQAVIAIEDRRFHQHFGFDPVGFTRAMVRNVIQKRMREGGSTITQQLAKNLFLTPDRTLGRKVQELILAVWLETQYSKAEILELYLNRVYFGAGATGVDAAARRYFGKSAKHVTIEEAALLAGLLKAPSRYSPAKNPDIAQSRARVVLAAMQREGFVKRGHIDVKNIQPGEHARHYRSGPQHFVTDMVVKEVRNRLGTLEQDIVVETTVSPYMMAAAQSILAKHLDNEAREKNAGQAALVSMAPDGAIRALIGGRDYARSQFNRAVEAKRQPGSAFKSFVWLNAIERGYEPGSLMQDAPVRFGKWSPQNYDEKFRGAVSLNQALSQSLNTISAKLTMDAGPGNIAGTARRMGIKSKLTANASIALGTSEVSLMELVGAYAPFANGGLKVKPYLVKHIATSSGKALFSRPQPLPIEVVDHRSLGMMNAMLRDVVENGTGKNARINNRIAAGKTGTSQNFRDALFVGYTARLVSGVWFGNDDNSPTKKLTGGSLPALAWKEFTQASLRDLPSRDLPGEPVYLALLPQDIPIPTRRPHHHLDQQQTASLKQRVSAALEPREKKSILDLILGN